MQLICKIECDDRDFAVSALPEVRGWMEEQFTILLRKGAD